MPNIAWTPRELGSAVSVWLDTLDPSYWTLATSGRVQQWRSKTSNGFVLGTGGGLPTVDSNNGVTVFSGGQDYNYFTQSTAAQISLLPQGTSDATVLFVGKLRSANYAQTLKMVGTNGSGGRNIGTVYSALIGLPQSGGDVAGAGSVVAAATGNMVVGQWAGGAAGASIANAVWIDGGAVATGNVTALTSPIVRFELLTNSSSGAPLDNVCATLIVNRLLTTGERQQLEGWAAWSFNLVPQLPASHPYKTAAPTVGTAVAAGARCAVYFI